MPDRTFGAVTVLVGENNGKYPDGNSLWIRGRDAGLVVDPSLTVAARAPELAERVDLVVQSHVHEDHLAGLFRFPSAEVHAHRADVHALHSLDGLMALYGYDHPGLREMVVAHFHYAPRPDAQPFDDGAVFDLGGTRVRAIHLAGHTRGHCALLVEPEGVLFLGDIDLTGFGPYYGDAASDLAAFERSIARVRDIDARVWVSFHHAGVVEDRATFLAKLDRFAGRIAEREAALLDFLRDPHRLDDLVAHRFLYPQHVELPFVDDAERGCITQHLDRLVAQGRVERDEAGWYRAVPGG